MTCAYGVPVHSQVPQDVGVSGDVDQIFPALCLLDLKTALLCSPLGAAIYLLWPLLCEQKWRGSLPHGPYQAVVIVESTWSCGAAISLGPGDF